MSRISVAAPVFILLMMCVPAQPGVPEPDTPVQPRVEWIGDVSYGDPTNIEYRDTDKDGMEEIFFWAYGTLRVYDPPSCDLVLAVDNLHEFEGPVFEDLGGNGSTEIVVYSSDYEGSHNYSVYSGSDFSLLWKSPDWRLPVLNGMNSAVHEIADVDDDGHKEFIWLANVTDRENLSARLFIYDGASHEMEWTSPPFDDLTSIELRNIDSDPALEILGGLWTYDWEQYDLSLDSLFIYDGATHQLQWEIPGAPGLRFNIRPLFETPDGYYHNTMEDINNDNIPDIVVEYRQAVAGGKNESGIRVYNGGTGALEWAAAVSIRGGHLYSGVIRDISDVDGDRVKELVVVPDLESAGGNFSDILVLSGDSGAPEMNTTSIGTVASAAVADLYGDGGRELLLSERWNETFETVETAFEVLDLRAQERLWAAGPFNVSFPQDGNFHSALNAQDLDGDGRPEAVWANYTATHAGQVERFTEDYINHTFSVLDRQNFSVIWTSPPSSDRTWLDRVNLLAFDNASGPVFAALQYDPTGFDHRNNTVGIYSMKDYRLLWKGAFADGRLSVKAVDLVNDSRKELVVGIDPSGYGSGSENLFFVLDSRTFEILWSSPGSENHRDPYTEMPVFSGNLTGGPGRELSFCKLISGEYNSPMDWTPDHTVLSVYDDTGFLEIWNSTLLEGNHRIIDIRDFDYDSSVEILMLYGYRPIMIGFPENTRWAPGIDFPEPSVRITAPADGSTVGGRLDITGTASDAFSVEDVWVSIEGIEGGPATLVRSADNRSCGWHYVWNVTGTMPGSHDIKVTATNILGNHARANITVQAPGRMPWLPQPRGPAGPDYTTLACSVTVLVVASCVIALIVFFMLFWRRRPKYA